MTPVALVHANDPLGHAGAVRARGHGAARRPVEAPFGHGAPLDSQAGPGARKWELCGAFVPR
eukprot:4032441-Lingulodinium_polyedra.AAC.1